MLEYGQPMHAFDYNYLNSNKIVVRRAKKDEKLITLDDQERLLDESMLVIADGDKSVALAGVMGGANSEITDDTKVIVFESANFEGVSVRTTAKKLGLRTESSSRFEKGLDSKNTIYALDRAVQLIEQLNCGTIVSGTIDKDNSDKEPRKISYNPKRINKILGSEISQNVMTEILIKLEFEVDEDKMEIVVPSFRSDVALLEDVVEEVARFYGYNEIKATLLEGKHMTIGKRTDSQIIKKSIKDNLLAMGYSELFTYSFTGTKSFDKICLSDDDYRRNVLKISNPLGEDYSIMRTTMIPEMLEVLSRNYNHRIESVKMFELSNIYIPTEKGKLPDELPNLLVGMYGDGDFFNIKGTVEVLFERLGISNYDFEVEENDNTFHPGRTANILIDGKKIGIMGEIHPNVLENYEIDDRVYIAQIDVLDLINNTNTEIECKNLPKYPAIDRDIAIIIDDKIMVKEIENIIVECSGKLLEEYKLFDLYRGNQIEQGKKSVAYSVKFRNYERTLKDKEVNKIMNKIINKLQNDLNAKLR
jgi:phenylalanyl-tRNA synthetase beta chain